MSWLCFGFLVLVCSMFLTVAALWGEGGDKYPICNYFFTFPDHPQRISYVQFAKKSVSGCSPFPQCCTVFHTIDKLPFRRRAFSPLPIAPMPFPLPLLEHNFWSQCCQWVLWTVKRGNKINTGFSCSSQQGFIILQD